MDYLFRFSGNLTFEKIAIIQDHFSPGVMALVSHNRMVPTSEIGYFMYCKCEV